MATFTMSARLIMRYNKLEREMEKAMSEAEKNCRKLHMSGVCSSPKLKKPMLTITYWKGIKNKITGKRVSGRWLRRLNKMLKIPPGKSTESEICTHLKEAYKQYYKYKGDAEDLRMTFLQEKVMELEDKADK